MVVHLAFSLMGEGDQTRAINVDGSRTVFEATAKAGAERICYASSVAAYGFHDDNPMWLTEDVPARGTPEHFYSAQKAEVETILDTAAREPPHRGVRVPAVRRRRARAPRTCSTRCPTTASPTRCPTRFAACSPTCRSCGP